ncbi:MAG: protoheme IX farnesyltransferase [Fervidicoccaceae archaeon]
MKMKAIFADLFKPIQTAFLVLSGLISYTVSSGGSLDWRVLLMLTFSLYFTISGTTGLNMYLDRDIDSMMERTKKRALPSRKLNEGDAVYASALFLSIGLLLSALINWGVFIAGLLGAIVDLAIYTKMLKRRTPLNVIFGSIAGGMPALGGWLAHPSSPIIGGILIASLVALWSLNHIWFIASYYSEDYIRARVPMLPVVAGRNATGNASGAVVLAMIIIVTSMWMVGILRFWALIILYAYMAYMLFLQFKYMRSGERAIAKRIFRGYTAFLGIAMVLMLLSALL